MASPVLDSSAILAVMFDEPGSAMVTNLLQRALVSSVSLAEVQARLVLEGVPPDFAWSRLTGMGFEVCPFDAEQARIAGELIVKTRPAGLSFAGRACLALAIQRGEALYTADSGWKELDLAIDMEVIR